MVQVSYPGVYVQEVPSGVRTITGVATSIAAFVGAASKGRIFEPTTILGFTDYARLFATDTSVGEMTDQVRQFFLNGGQQAIIVRVANGATAAVAPLQNSAGTVFALKARGVGKGGEALRARVDYDTSSPERTFNLTIYEEAIDANGDGSVVALETLRNLSLESTDPRYFALVVDEQSQFALVDPLTPVTLGTRQVASSLSAKTAASAAALSTLIGSAITGTSGKFRVKVGTAAWVVVEVATTGPGTFVDRVNTAVQAATGNAAQAAAVVIDAGGATALSIFSADANNGDILVDRALDSDIAAALGLGTAQGGLEIGSLAHRRPLASGYVSQLSAVADVTSLLNMTKAAFTDGFSLSGPAPFVVPAGTAAFPTTGTLGQNGSETSLTNLAQDLQRVADAINLSTAKWRAEVHGLRLALVPSFGNAASGPGHVFANPTADVFAGATARAYAGTFGGATDGSVAQPTDYDTAFNAIDSKVDLFNIMVLPKPAGTDTRSSLWQRASAFCEQRRAFLLIDAKTETTSIDAVLAEVESSLRIGVVKDHAALYWPRLKINPDGSPRHIDASGSIAGIMARIDGSRGVWKAPAGLDSDVRGVLGVQTLMSDPENGRINPQAVNAIRAFPNGILSWGARTLDGFDNSGNDDYKYVPVRRLALFLEESLVRGLKFAVFEPNDEPLWAQIRLAAGAFMNNLFRQGAFQGRTSRDAYFVKVDAETTTQNDINLGIVNVVVGFAPLKPAEFVVITIQQKAGQIQV